MLSITANTMVDELDGNIVDGDISRSMNAWKRIGPIAVALPIMLLGGLTALADTLPVTCGDGLSVYYGGDSGDWHGSHSLSTLRVEQTFTIRNGTDTVTHEFELRAQASADSSSWTGTGPLAYARVQGVVQFDFNLPNTVAVWDIRLDYDYFGVVANDGHATYASAETVNPYGTGVVSLLGIPSASVARPLPAVPPGH